MRRVARWIGTVAVVAGVGMLAWAVVVWRWEDPVTGLYGEYRQYELGSEYDEFASAYAERIARVSRPAPPGDRRDPPSLEEIRATLAAQARRYRATLGHGKPLGRLRIPKLGLDAVVTNGSDAGSLRNGPGRDERTFMPGEGELVYIAGHRTTYTAPFSHIERLRAGDRVLLEVPYATFEYAVTQYEVVPNDAVDRLESRGREELRLQASHPRFFSSHRYLAYAEPRRVRLHGEQRFHELGARPAG